jgi:isoquinoline 1-oxidoreductase beta subunit
MAKWSNQKVKGRGKGLAAGYFQGAFVAEIVEVVFDNTGKLTVPNIWAAVDCGIVINPLGAHAQVEGAILEGLSAALYNEISIVHGKVQQDSFNSYGWIRMKDVPKIHIEFIRSSEPPGGLGEPPLPAVAPALCNAIFAACGKRLRKLPFINSL